MSKSKYEKMLEEQLSKEPQMIKFEREFEFLSGRRFKFDFANVEHKIAIEIEGGTQYKSVKVDGKWYIPVSGHNSTKGIERDIEKYNLATLLGWKVFRFTGDQVKDGSALFFLDKAVRMLREKGLIQDDYTEGDDSAALTECVIS